MFSSIPLPAIQLSLAIVLKSGQSFRWSAFPLFREGLAILDAAVPTHEYRLCLPDRVICLRQAQDTLFYRAVFPEPQPLPEQLAVKEAETLAWLNDYFQLHIDLKTLYDEWSTRDPIFKGLRHRFAGIRILRQDPWENLVSFICSSNNNISRITKMVQSLCSHFTPPLLSLPDPSHNPSDGPPPVQTYHPFPPPSVLALPDVTATLRALGFGYRAEFIQRTARMLVDAHHSPQRGNSPLVAPEPAAEWLFTLRQMSTNEARGELLQLMGVGRKVADCVLLMSLDKREVVPVDTHVHQIAIKHYGLRSSTGKTKANMTPKLYDEVNRRLRDVWGDYAGWAHSVLFTSDLKPFLSYGIGVSQSQTTAIKAVDQSAVLSAGLPTPSPTPSPVKKTSRRRKRSPSIEDTITVPDSPLSLAERVKMRRRFT